VRLVSLGRGGVVEVHGEAIRALEAPSMLGAPETSVD